MISERFVAELKGLLGAGDEFTADNALTRLREFVERNDKKISDLTKQIADKHASFTAPGPDLDSGKSMLLGAGILPKDSQ